MFRCDGAIESCAIACRFIRFVFSAFPIRVERGAELLKDVWRLHLRKPDVPFDAVNEGRLRQVRRADVGGREAGGPNEQPCLRVQAGGLRVIRHLDLRPTLDQPVECFPLGGSGEDRGDHAQPAPRPAVCRELCFEKPQPMPADKGTEQVDGVGGRDFVRQCMSEIGLAAGVDQQVRRRQRAQRRDDIAVVIRRARQDESPGVVQSERQLGRRAPRDQPESRPAD